MNVEAEVRDFLRWVGERSASYDEAWEVWQTTCPRHSTWEDSFIDGLVRVEHGPDATQTIVLTELGRSIVESS